MRYGCVFLFAIALLSACGGGGGGTTGGNPPPTATPQQTPTTPPTASFSGVLVDHETGAALGGIKVGLAPNTAGASPNPQGTTAADGSFSGVAPAPGTYLLVIGNDTYPDSSNRPTIHHLVNLAAGTNALTAWSMPGILCGAPNNLNPCPSPSPLEQGTKFRLTTLTSAEQACLAYENTTRTSKGLKAVVSDEWLAEQNRFYWSIATSTNSAPAYPGSIGYDASDGNGADCTDMIAGNFVLNGWPAFSSLAWYAGDAGGANHVASSQGMVDPRATPYPTPSPANPWP